MVLLDSKQTELICFCSIASKTVIFPADTLTGGMGCCSLPAAGSGKTTTGTSPYGQGYANNQAHPENVPTQLSVLQA